MKLQGSSKPVTCTFWLYLARQDGGAIQTKCSGQHRCPVLGPLVQISRLPARIHTIPRTPLNWLLGERIKRLTSSWETLGIPRGQLTLHMFGFLWMWTPGEHTRNHGNGGLHNTNSKLNCCILQFKDSYTRLSREVEDRCENWNSYVSKLGPTTKLTIELIQVATLRLVMWDFVIFCNIHYLLPCIRASMVSS